MLDQTACDAIITLFINNHSILVAWIYYTYAVVQCSTCTLNVPTLLGLPTYCQNDNYNP